MPVEIRLSREAEADLDDILQVLLSDLGAKRAGLVFARVTRSIDMLAEHPRAGPARDSLGERRRILPVRPWVVVYQIEPPPEGEFVLILRVLHGARDVEAIFNSD